jgi:hypothetical protein
VNPQRAQELVERETTQSEVLHMECKETGEFAHRETTQYEQMETFNDEVRTGLQFLAGVRRSDEWYVVVLPMCCRWWRRRRAPRSTCT